MKNISFKTAKNDIIAGIIVALVSIPISMGYAQIAGLPAAYGLYGSLLPVLVYAFTTSSPQFVFGVDATPAVLVGGTLAALGVTTGSDEAMRLVPAIDVYKRQGVSGKGGNAPELPMVNFFSSVCRTGACHAPVYGS